MYPVPDHQQTLVAVAKDKEMPATSVGLYYKLPRRGTLTSADYRRYVVEAIYHGMMNGRLDELTRAADPPFLAAGSATQPLVRVKDVFMQLAATKQDGVVRGLEALTREVERVDRHGFTPGELDRAKTDLLRGLEQVGARAGQDPLGPLRRRDGAPLPAPGGDARHRRRAGADQGVPARHRPAGDEPPGLGVDQRAQPGDRGPGAGGGAGAAAGRAAVAVRAGAEARTSPPTSTR